MKLKFIIISILIISALSASAQIDSTLFCKKWHFGKAGKLKKNIKCYFPAKTPWSSGIVEQYFQFNRDGTVYWSTQGKPLFGYSGNWKLFDKNKLIIEFKVRNVLIYICHLFLTTAMNQSI